MRKQKANGNASSKNTREVIIVLLAALLIPWSAAQWETRCNVSLSGGDESLSGFHLSAGEYSPEDHQLYRKSGGHTHHPATPRSLGHPITAAG